MPSRSSVLKNMGLLTISIFITLALMELALRIADFPKQPMKPDKIKDSILIYRIPSDWPGIDKDGFRNRSIPERADIVALGDSHTYGLNADIDTNWPGQLAKMTGLSVYNLGIGGYGPLQYYYLFDRALQLKPKYIIVGLYLPNDIKGLCHPYLRTEYWKRQALSEGLNLRYCAKSEFPEEEGEESKSPGLLQKIGGLLVNSKLGVLVSITARRLRAYLPKNEEKNVVVSDGRNDTIMSKPRLRMLTQSMDISQPEIASSLAATKTLISRMGQRSREKDIRLVVMIIPSKEYIFSQYLQGTAKKLPEVFIQTSEKETALRKDVMSWLEQQDIHHVDVASKVLEAVRSSGGIYSHDNDGHPLPAGYTAYARALYDGYFKGTLP